MSELSLLQTFDLKFEVTTHLLCHGPVLLVHQPVLPLPLPDAEVADLVVHLVANLEEEKDLVLIKQTIDINPTCMSKLPPSPVSIPGGNSMILLAFSL